MCIHETDAPLEQGLCFDHPSYFARLSDFDHREQIKSGDRLLPGRQVAKDQLRNNKWVDGNVAALKLLIKLGISFPKVIDPHRSVRENHLALVLRRGM
jgi:hypothetical protein